MHENYTENLKYLLPRASNQGMQMYGPLSHAGDYKKQQNRVIKNKKAST